MTARDRRRLTLRQLLLMAFGLMLVAAGVIVATPADATPLDGVVATIRDSGGRYQTAGASLAGADCSGLVSVAQSLAMGRPVRRLGDTHSLLAGRWPDVIRGASPDDAFVIAANRGHMVARIRGVNIEARQSGERFRIGPDAVSPFDAQFVARFHVDPNALRTA